MRTTLLLLLAAAVLAALSALIDPYLRFLVAQLAILVIAVTSLNLLGNVAGMLSLASAAFMGLGGYATLIFLTVAGIPLPLSVPLALLTGWLTGWILGLIAVRLSGISLAIATFGFVQIVQVLIKQDREFSGVGYGLIVLPLDLPGWGPVTPGLVSILCVFAAALTVLLTREVTASRIGRAWYALKDQPVAAEMQGVNLVQMRALAFATTGAMATLAGALQALLLGITNPNLYVIDNSIGHLAMMVVGGALQRRRKSVGASLSGGERQLLSIAKVLIRRPRLLLLDGPSIGLAPTMVEELQRIVVRLSGEGLSVLIGEQAVSWVVPLADRAYAIGAGRILRAGPAAELAEAGSLAEPARNAGATPISRSPPPQVRGRSKRGWSAGMSAHSPSACNGSSISPSTLCGRWP